MGAAFQYSFPRLLQDFQLAFPGEQRVQSFSYLADTLCFQNPDGSLILFLRNLEAARTANLCVDGDGKARTLQIPERSLAAFRL